MRGSLAAGEDGAAPRPGTGALACAGKRITPFVADNGLPSASGLMAGCSRSPLSSVSATANA